MELCFADDIHVPHFPNLVKTPYTEQDELDESEELVDRLIKSSPLDLNIPKGPVDPAAKKMRETIAFKILGESINKSSLDTLDSYFKPLELEEMLLTQLKQVFPLTVSKAKVERATGVDIFNKRCADINIEENEEKKPKLDSDVSNAANVKAVDDGYDADDLVRF